MSDGAPPDRHVLPRQTVRARPRLRQRAQTDWYLAGTLAVVASAASIAVAPGLEGALGAALGCVAAAIAIADARRFIIPDGLVVVGLGLGLVRAAADASLPVADALAGCALRAAGSALVLWTLRAAYSLVRGREGIGLGDVKLAGVAGAWLDWTTIAIVVEAAALSALAVYAVRSIGIHRRFRRVDRLPFGFFLAPTIWGGWLLATILRGG